MSVRWYQWPSVERQLVVFAKSFLGPHAFTVRLEDDRWICPTGSCDFNQHAIVVNPTACDGEPQAQYLVTRGLLAHEVGHARYTTPRDGTAPVVQQLTNILEDERVERIMGGQFWSVRAALTAVSRYAYTVSRPLGEPHGTLQDPDDPRWVVLAALQWRWAVRLGEPLKGRLSAVNQQRWMRIQPLVEQAWAAPDTARVYDLAEQVAAILGLRQPLPEAMLPLLAVTRGSRSGAAERRPSLGADWTGQDDVRAPGDQLPGALVGGDTVTPTDWRLAPPGPLMRAAEPLAGELVERLDLPAVARTPEWTDRYGRLSLRAAIRSQDATPFVVHEEPEPDPAAVAIGVLLDRSGSMDGPRMAAARVAAATLHLACAQLGIWHAVVAFEGADTVLGAGDASEPALARLAGLRAATGSRVGASYQHLLEQMIARPEPVKVAVVIHDGQPDDADTVVWLNRTAAEARIEVLGLGLELEDQNRAAMRTLFGDRYIECQRSAALAPTLAAVLNTLRRR